MYYFGRTNIKKAERVARKAREREDTLESDRILGVVLMTNSSKISRERLAVKGTGSILQVTTRRE